MKFCKDCEYGSIGGGLATGINNCFHPDHLNEVTGGGRRCEMMRKTHCIDGILFKPVAAKPKRSVFELVAALFRHG